MDNMQRIPQLKSGHPWDDRSLTEGTPRSLEYIHPIDLQSRREVGGGVGWTGPVAADREVQDEVEMLVV